MQSRKKVGEIMDRDGIDFAFNSKEFRLGNQSARALLVLPIMLVRNALDTSIFTDGGI